MVSEQNWNNDLEQTDPKLFAFLRDYEKTPAERKTDAIAERAETIQRLKFELLAQLISYRRQRHLTQRALAKKMGIQQSSIARLESGRGNPSLATLLAIAAELGLRLKLND